MSHDLKVQRVLDATADDVFEAFTSAEAQRTWFRGPGEPDMIVEIECDPRVGGQWVSTWGEIAAEVFRETCVFQVVDRPRRLVMASTVDTPDGQRIDSEVEITLDQLDGKTRVTIVQTGLPSAELRDFLTTTAWPGALDRIEWYVGRPAPFAARDSEPHC